MASKRTSLVLLPALALFASGCLHGPSAVKRDLSQAAGVELEQEFGFTLGRVGTWFAKQGLKIAQKHSDDEIPVSLKGVRKVSVGVYNVEGLRAGEARSVEPGDLDLGPSWYPIVKVRDSGEDVFVMLREEENRINALLVVVAAQDEWVLVKVRGNLNRVIEDGMRFGFDAIDRPDLYAATRRERGLDDEPGEETEQPERCDDVI